MFNMHAQFCMCTHTHMCLQNHVSAILYVRNFVHAQAYVSAVLEKANN
uniref:Uncharacterized protein n=1 Tax=Ciona intestinalis TaxID=7719 RepID=H2XNU1_CIOIN